MPRKDYRTRARRETLRQRADRLEKASTDLRRKLIREQERVERLRKEARETADRLRKQIAALPSQHTVDQINKELQEWRRCSRKLILQTFGRLPLLDERDVRAAFAAIRPGGGLTGFGCLPELMPDESVQLQKELWERALDKEPLDPKTAAALREVL